MKERATKQEWLEWFYVNADFGPGDSDARGYLKERFMRKTGKNLPEGFNHAEDGETIIDR